MCAIAGTATAVTTSISSEPHWWLQAQYLERMKELVAKGEPALSPYPGKPVVPPPEIDWLAINREIAGA